MPGTFDEITGTARSPKERVATHDAGVEGASDSGQNLLEAQENTAGMVEQGGKDSRDPVAGVDSEAAMEEDALGEAGSRTPRQIREVAKELSRYGLIEAARKPNLYRVLQNERQAVSAVLEPLDFDLVLDDVRGLAFITVRADASKSDLSIDEATDVDDWSHPLVRRLRLTLEQSLLVAILRQHFVAHEQEAGVGADDARVAVDELIPEFQIYLGDPGSEAKERTRMLTLLDQLKSHGIVTEADSHERVTIRPIIAHLASPENLQHLLVWLRQRQKS